jgi:plastocyanin
VVEAAASLRRAVIRCAAAALSAAALPALAETRTITIDGMQFSPPVLTAKQGDAVVWVNKDLVPHTATAAPAFDSGSLGPGASWRMPTMAPGRYEYICTLHPTMKAVLVVE